MLRTNKVVRRVGQRLKAKDFIPVLHGHSILFFGNNLCLDTINSTNRDNGTHFQTVSPQICLLLYTSYVKFWMKNEKRELKVAFTPVAGLINFSC